MRILHILPDLNPLSGGITSYVAALVQEQSAQGDEPHVLTLDQGGPTASLPASIPLTALPAWKIHYRYSPALRPWLRQHAESFDHVILHGLWQYHCSGAATELRRLGIPYTVFPHGMLDPWFKRAWLKHLKKWLYWPWTDFRTLAQAHAVAFTTVAERDKAGKSFWLYAARGAIAPLGIAEPQLPGSDLFLEKFPETKNRRLILFLSRIHVKKGPDLLLKSFAETLSDDPAFHLVLAGPCEKNYRAELDALAESLHLQNRITWTGMLEGDLKWSALQAGELFVLPSHGENFGMAVVEALAASRPVIITNKVDLHPTISDESCGFICEDTPESLSTSLTRWRESNDSTRRALSLAARSCFEKNFTLSHSAKNLRDILTGPPPAVLRGSQGRVLGWLGVLLALFILLEFALRLGGLVSQPIFLKDDELGYIPAPNQSGAFLGENHWQFNERSMGAGPYQPHVRPNILLLGDSIVLGGNPLDESERLGPRLQQFSNHQFSVWPISAPSWSSANESVWLRKNDDVVRDADVLIWVLNSGDFDHLSKWQSPRWHPLHPPLIASWFLFDKYVIPRTWDVFFPPEGDHPTPEIRQDFFWKFSKMVHELHGRHPSLVIQLVWYPQASELKTPGNVHRGLYEEYAHKITSLAQPPLVTFLDISEQPEWRNTDYRDSMHPNVEGNRLLAALLLRQLRQIFPEPPQP